MDLTEFRDELAGIPPLERTADRHRSILAWFTRLSEACGCERPVLVGCGAVEIYTETSSATGDVDLICPDIQKMSSVLLEVGFQRSSNQRFFYHPPSSVLIEFPSSRLRPGEETVLINLEGIECRVISPVDLIVDRLETFEASGGGTDLMHAWLIFYFFHDQLDLTRLKTCVKNRDVVESFHFLSLMNKRHKSSKLSIKEMGQMISDECRRRIGE